MVTLYTAHCSKCSVSQMKLKDLNTDFDDNNSVDKMIDTNDSVAKTVSMKWFRNQKEDYMITLYTTHCPKCSVLQMKLKDLNIDFDINDNVDEMVSMGLASAPMLDVDGVHMDFSEALKWIRNQEED